MGETKKYLYQTIFGDNYDIEYQGKLGKTGDYESVLFTVLAKKVDNSKQCEVVIKISGTLIAVWGLENSVLEDVLGNLGLLKTYLLIENEELGEGRKEYMFSTYGVNNSAKSEIDKLNTELNELREEHKTWVENTRKSYFTNSDLILKIQKDHADFQGSNAKELRASLLQLSSISGAIVGAVVALGSNEIGQNWILLASLVLLSVSTGLPFLYTTAILQNLIVGTFKKLMSITSKLEEISASEFKFIREPSVKNYRNTEDLWKKHSDIVRQNLDKTTEIKKDNMLTVIQFCFTFGIVLLVISFVYSNFTRQKVTFEPKNPLPITSITPTVTQKIEVSTVESASESSKKLR